MKLLVFRRRFFRDGWNIFDLLIVVISLMPATQGLKVIRTLRVLRILRLMSAIPSMRVVISGLLRAIPGMMSAIALLMIVIYVFAILANQLFGADCFPGYLDRCEPFFGTLPSSLFTLFQIMTLESWSHGIVRPIADVYPWARWFFVLYVTVTAFAALNLFIGVVVNAMDSAQSDDDTDTSVANAGGSEPDGSEPGGSEPGGSEPGGAQGKRLQQIQAELAEIKALLLKTKG